MVLVVPLEHIQVVGQWLLGPAAGPVLEEVDHAGHRHGVQASLSAARGLLAAVGLALVVTGPVAKKVGSGLHIGNGAVVAWDIAKWPVMAAVVLLAIAMELLAAPPAQPPRPQPIISRTAAVVGRDAI